MIARRLWAKPTPASRSSQTALWSGPRWRMLRAIAVSVRSASASEDQLPPTKPAMPHIDERASLSVSRQEERDGPFARIAMVRTAGLEPARPLGAEDFKSPASTGSATSAWSGRYHKL